MCGIVGLLLRDEGLYPELGSLMAGMVTQLAERGPDSAGLAIYGDPTLTPPGSAAVSLLASGLPADLSVRLGAEVTLYDAGQSVVVRAPGEVEALVAAVRRAAPEALVIGYGREMAVLKGVGNPLGLIEEVDLAGRQGWQGVAHTRMATESAVTPAGSHPFSVGAGQCLVHNGSFANHATIRRELRASGVAFDSENDSEVGARFVAAQLALGADLDKALRLLTERFDGFYTLLVTTDDTFAVVRDAIACKPAVIAETDAWIAMASEYRALAGLPGVARARIFEPEPEEVYTWQR
jgi:glutamate synthase domain-containing protein 1